MVPVVFEVINIKGIDVKFNLNTNPFQKTFYLQKNKNYGFGYMIYACAPMEFKDIEIEIYYN